MTWYTEFRAREEEAQRQWHEERGYVEIPHRLQKYLGGYKWIQRDELQELKNLIESN